MAFLDKLNKMAKTIEDKTADAIEMSNYNAAITAGENGFTMDIRRIGEFYYEFFINGGTVEPNILPVLQSAKAHQDAIAQAKADIEKLNAEIAAEKAERAAAREAAKAEKEAAKAAEAAAKVAEEEAKMAEEAVAEEIVE